MQVRTYMYFSIARFDLQRYLIIVVLRLLRVVAAIRRAQSARRTTPGRCVFP